MSAERTEHSTRIGDHVEPVWRLPGVSDDICAAVGADDGSDALRAEAIVHAEIKRLEQVFSIADARKPKSKEPAGVLRGA